MEHYSRLDTRAQWVVQRELVRMMDEAAELTGLDRAAWRIQPQGDLELAVLPEATPEEAVLGPLVQNLALCLTDANTRPATPRIRLRMAVDTGVVADAALGHAGPAPVAVARYVNAPQLKAALATLAVADLAVIVSDRLYQDVVRSRRWDLDPAQYVRAHVQVKEFGGYGWIHVPGQTPDVVRSAVAEPPQDLSQTDSPGRPTLSQRVHHGAAVGRDVVGGLSIGPCTPAPWAGSGSA
ncbi:hypothetical protein [Streptomyces xiamenensis]|uniref:hypothetical protein n=1 Tax=Streptomyces xiamenensis TaxID=408015 RepID=UPI0037D4666B